MKTIKCPDCDVSCPDMCVLMCVCLYSMQAVWAGWGHASENPKLPDLLQKFNITFLGPPSSAMWALGDKIASSIVAQTASVPTLPWSGQGITRLKSHSPFSILHSPIILFFHFFILPSSHSLILPFSHLLFPHSFHTSIPNSPRFKVTSKC